MRRVSVLLLVVAAGIVATAGRAVMQTPSPPAADGLFAVAPAEVAAPSPAGSAQPHLAADSRGRVWLSWLESLPTRGHAFRAARWTNDRWTPPMTIAEGTDFFANWADVPSIFVTSTGTIAAHWLQKGGSGTYDYGVRVRTSTDDGRTWSAVETPHKDGTPTEHGFVSFFEAGGGTPGLIWLDGRATAGHDAAGAAGGHGGGGAMTLRSSVLSGGKAGPDLLVDDRVCDCCPTSAARTLDGVLVAYRDRSAREVRDIAVSRFANGAWTTPTVVHDDGWEINGCPVNGPAIAASGKNVVVAWFTQAGGGPRVRAAFSTDAGATFGRAIEVYAGTTLGRVGVLMLDDTRALVSSLDRLPGAPLDGGSLVVREVRADGRVSAPTRIGAMRTERPSGTARMVQSGRRVFFAWTEAPRGVPSQVKLAVATLK